MKQSLITRVLDLTYKYRLSHVGSCLTAVGIIDKIYKRKKPDEKFILSQGHAHLAHLVVMEKYEGKKINNIHDIHCNLKDGCDVSTGSLGQGLPIAVGMALANRNKNIYCLISDGECAEGSIWESLRIAREQKLFNLKIYLNANGYGAYGKIDTKQLERQIEAFRFPVEIRITNSDTQFSKGLNSHYHVISKKDYEKTR